MRRARTAGVLGALAGAAAAGLAGGIAVERFVLRRGRPGPDPYVTEPFDALPADATPEVRSADGTRLHAEVVEPAGGGPARLTVVFVHGLALDSGTFHFQRRALADCTLPVRAVFYDQPGHGRSEPSASGEYRIDALGDTLHRVIEQLAADGPLALVGHSMGGMAIMALAERYPQLFGEHGRVRAVALLSSSAGQLAESPLGLPRILARPRQRLLPVLAAGAQLRPAVIDRARGAAGELAYLLTRRFGFVGEASPSVVSYVERMNSRTSIGVIAGFVDTLFAHDRAAALAVLAHTDVLIVAGGGDQLVPAEHAREMHRRLPESRLVVVDDAGHMALLQRPEVVGEALRKLLATAVETRGE